MPDPHARQRRAAFLITGLLLFLAAGCAERAVEVVETRPGMDTLITVRAVAPTKAAARRAVEAAWEEMDLCIARLDRYRAGSDLARINADAGKWHTSVDPLVTSGLAAAKEVYDVSHGAFDPTVGPLVDLWKAAQDRDRPPTDEEIAKARGLVGMDKVEILAAEVQKLPTDLAPVPPGEESPEPAEPTALMCSVGIRAGMSLDLGGIAKGYIAGRMARRMHQAGAVAGLVAAAGDAYAFGLRPASLVRREGGSSLWSVAVLDPRYPLDRSHFYTTVYLRDQAVDTSGHYYRGYTIGGRRYSHILDPRTGRPVDARLASITVVAPDPALSDGLATAIAVLGAKDGLALVESLDGVECLLLETVPPENPPAEGQPPAPVPPEPACPVGRSIRLVAHRSSGFAALEAAPPR